MLSPVFALIVLSAGFVAGYLVRAFLSRKRRAMSREAWRKRRDQKHYDDGTGSISPSIVFSVPDEALGAAANADQLAKPSCHPSVLPKAKGPD